MRSNEINKRLAFLEDRAKPRMLVTLADLVLWRAKWRRGIKEEVEIDPILEDAFRDFNRGHKPGP
jgi:hypothetical protein